MHARTHVHTHTHTHVHARVYIHTHTQILALEGLGSRRAEGKCTTKEEGVGGWGQRKTSHQGLAVCVLHLGHGRQVGSHDGVVDLHWDLHVLHCKQHNQQGTVGERARTHAKQLTAGIHASLQRGHFWLGFVKVKDVRSANPPVQEVIPTDGEDSKSPAQVKLNKDNDSQIKLKYFSLTQLFLAWLCQS